MSKIIDLTETQKKEIVNHLENRMPMRYIKENLASQGVEVSIGYIHSNFRRGMVIEPKAKVKEVKIKRPYNNKNRIGNRIGAPYSLGFEHYENEHFYKL